MTVLEHLRSILDLDVEKRGVTPLTNDSLSRMLDAARRSSSFSGMSLQDIIKDNSSSNVNKEIADKLLEVAKEGTKDEGYHTDKVRDQIIPLDDYSKPYLGKEGDQVVRLFTKEEVFKLCSKAYKDGAWWAHIHKQSITPSSIVLGVNWIDNNLKD